MADDDGNLVRKCLGGDALSVRAFVERFQGVVFGLCFRMLGHREDAEDVAQEVFLRAIRSLKQWDAARPLKPWLLTIAANRCRTALSQRARKPRATEFVTELPDRAAASSPDLAEELQLALDNVREDYRLCFILYHQHEMNLVEISETLGCPEGTVKTWLFRVRRELAEHLRRRGVVPGVNHELHRI